MQVLHLLFFSSWFLAWGSVTLGMLAQLPRLWTILLLAVAAWAFVIVAIVLVVHEHALLLRAAALLAIVNLRL